MSPEITCEDICFRRLQLRWRDAVAIFLAVTMGRSRCGNPLLLAPHMLGSPGDGKMDEWASRPRCLSGLSRWALW